jgi:hypothetical protein
MIALNRRTISLFRVGVRRSILGRPRNLAFPILLQQTAEDLILFSALGEVAIALRVPSANASRCRLIAPWSIGDLVEKVVEEGVVEIAEIEGNRLRCRWSDSKETHQEDLDVPAIDGFKFWNLPQHWKSMDSSLLEALHECGKVTAKEKASRFALTRLQLRGDSGSIIGTDSKQLLLWKGFCFPFTDRVLIPAIPLFGSREPKIESEISLGRTEESVVARMGPWTVWLKIDPDGRFPDVMNLIPPSSRGRLLTLDELDVRTLLPAITKGLTIKEELGIQFDLTSPSIVRFPNEDSDRSRDRELCRSHYSGPPTQVLLNRRHLTQALTLGFRQMEIPEGKAPIVFRDSNRTYLTLALEIGNSQVDSKKQSAKKVLPPPLTGESKFIAERTEVPIIDPEVEEVIDPFTEAEALGEAFWELTRRAGRFLTSLSHYQKYHPILKSTWSNLKQLLPHRKEES